MVATRLSTPETEFMDEVRGALSRGEYLRYLVVLAMKAKAQ